MKIVGAPSITKEQIPNISVNPWSSKEEAIDFYEGMYKTRQTKFQLKLTGITISGKLARGRNKGDTLTLHFANAGGAGAHTHNSRKLVRILLLYHLMAMLLIPITQVAFYSCKIVIIKF